MKKITLIMPIVALGVIGTTLFVTNATYAQTTNSPTDSLVQKIAQKFGLNKADVQQVFDEEREAKHAEMEKAYEQRLSDAVSNGELTEEKKQLILAKHAELEAQRPDKMDFQNMTDEERQARMTEMETKRQELETWASENNIDMKYLGFQIRVKHFGENRGEKNVMFYKAQ